MKKRYRYLLLFSLPAFLAALVVSLALFAGLAGLSWLFILGDEPWPAFADALLGGFFFLACLGLWLGLMAAAYLAGKRLETQADSSAAPWAWAIGATALLLLLIAMHQLSVGNIGPRSDSMACSDFCQGKGFAGSGTPPRNANDPSCICFDAQGREALKTPMSEAAAQAPSRAP